MRYDLNLLPVFLTLMEERSVTRAAERLGITQPALSNALARLRITLRDQLFIRDDKKTIADVVRETGKAIGDEITVTGFERIQLAAE